MGVRAYRRRTRHARRRTGASGIFIGNPIEQVQTETVGNGFSGLAKESNIRGRRGFKLISFLHHIFCREA